MSDIIPYDSYLLEERLTVLRRRKTYFPLVIPSTNFVTINDYQK